MAESTGQPLADSEELASSSSAEAPESFAATSPSEEASPKKEKGSLSVSRRSLIIGAGGTAVLLGLGALRFAGHNPIKRPPGGQDESHLISACIRCEKCYEACPRRIIKPAHIEDGLLGMRTPELDFNEGYCDFCASENNGIPLCVANCPTQALVLPDDGLAENTVRIGYAVIDEYQCLAYRDTGCHYCVEACPYQAISYSQNTGKSAALRPVVNTEMCNGCGACESVCVSLKAGSIVAGATERAITVKPLDY